LLGDYSKVDENCCDAVIVRETELAPFFAFHGLTSDGVDQSGRSAQQNLATNGQLFVNGAEQWGVSGELKWDLGGVKLTYIGSYRDFKSNSTQESDFVSLAIFTTGAGGQNSRPGILPTGNNIKTMTQELRLQGTAFNDHLDWLIRGFYSTEDIVEDQTMTFGTDYQRANSAFNFGPLLGPNPLFTFTAFGNGGVPVNAAGAYTENRFSQDAKSFSIFTHNVINFTDQLSLTLGARYVDEKKTASFDQLNASNGACQASVNGVLSGAFTGIGLPGAVQSGIVGLNCFPFAAPVTLTAPALVGGGLASNLLPTPREWSNVFKDNEITYTAQVGYKVTPDLPFYGGFSHGFKSGGFNLDPTAANITNSGAVLAGGGTVAPIFADPRFKSEKVDQIELGVKATFGPIKSNLALFDMKMSDFQVLEFTGVQFLTFNVNSARSTGAELELFGDFGNYMRGNVALTYADVRYPKNCTNGVSPDALASVMRLCGRDLTNAPKFTGVAGLTYDGPLNSSGWGLLVSSSINYSDSRTTRTIDLDTNNTPIPLARQENYFKMNARIGLTTPDERFTFEVWGTNLSNEITRGITANTPLRGGGGTASPFTPATRSLIGFIEEPRMYGLTVRAKF
jgi:iron complex outermembrane recepter protein